MYLILRRVIFISFVSNLKNTYLRTAWAAKLTERCDLWCGFPTYADWKYVRHSLYLSIVNSWCTSAVVSAKIILRGVCISAFSWISRQIKDIPCCRCSVLTTHSSSTFCSPAQLQIQLSLSTRFSSTRPLMSSRSSQSLPHRRSQQPGLSPTIASQTVTLRAIRPRCICLLASSICSPRYSTRPKLLKTFHCISLTAYHS